MTDTRDQIKLEVSPKEVYDHFLANAKREKDQQDNQRKVMDEKLKQATKGRSIVLSNCNNFGKLRVGK